jgi:hypothetical protein
MTDWNPASALLSEFEERAEAYWCQGRIQDALCIYESLRIEGEDPARNTGRRWEAWMYLGEFERAWQESDRHEGSQKDTSGRVLIRCCRGIGGAVQFLRFLPQLRRRCRRPEVETPEGLYPLMKFFRNSTGIDFSVGPYDSREFDCEVEFPLVIAAGP